MKCGAGAALDDGGSDGFGSEGLEETNCWQNSYHVDYTIHVIWNVDIAWSTQSPEVTVILEIS